MSGTAEIAPRGVMVGMENFIWLFAPSIGAAMFLATSRFFGFLRQKRALHVVACAAIVAGLFGLAMGPHCMCKNVEDMLLGAGVFAILLGVVASLFASVGLTLSQIGFGRQEK